jgi:biopolymer transport protein ExbD
MPIGKRLLMGVGAILAAALLLVLASPKSAHALVATLVQVANTTANPAVTLDADKATRIPYQSSSQGVDAITGGPCNGVDANCVFGLITAPSGYRLVVENISAYLYVSSGNPAPSGVMLSGAASTLQGATFFYGSYLGSNFQAAIINQSVKRYVNAGDGQYLFITADFRHDYNHYATVTGYLEDCAVTGCPPIQN